MKALLLALSMIGGLLSGTASAQAEPPAPSAPDYARGESWAVRPAQPGLASLRPAGSRRAAGAQPVDVFFVHPTTFRSTRQWNQDLADGATNRWTDESVIARQASLFRACCRVFAPRYRQASTRAFAEIGGDGQAAYALAYADVLAAFDHYLAHENRGRPIILAGHSQGALHILRLLEDRFAGKPLQSRLVAAYPVGIGIPAGAFSAGLAGLAPCTRTGEAGCVLSWNSFLEGSDVSAYMARNRAQAEARGFSGDGLALTCINPLTFDGARPEAPATASRGALPASASPLVRLPALHAAMVSARCSNGILMVSVDPALGLAPLPGGNMHYHDFALFYADVQADLARRIAAYWRRGK